MLGFKSQQDVTSLHSICITMTTRRQQQQRYATATAPFTLPLPLATLPSLSCLLHTPLPASLALLTVCCSSARYFYHFRFLQPDTFFALLHFALFFCKHAHRRQTHTGTATHTIRKHSRDRHTHTQSERDAVMRLHNFHCFHFTREISALCFSLSSRSLCLSYLSLSLPLVPVLVPFVDTVVSCSDFCLHFKLCAREIFSV